MNLFRAMRYIAKQTTSSDIQLILAKYGSTYIKCVLARNVNISEETIVELLENNYGDAFAGVAVNLAWNMHVQKNTVLDLIGYTVLAHLAPPQGANALGVLPLPRWYDRIAIAGPMPSAPRPHWT